MDETVAFLVDAGWLLETGKREGEGYGRKRGDYSVIPAVHGAAP